MQRLHLENSQASMLILHKDSHSYIPILTRGEEREEGRRWGGIAGFSGCFIAMTRVIFIIIDGYSLDNQRRFTAKSFILRLFGLLQE